MGNTAIAVLFITTAIPAWSADKDTEEARVKASGDVLQELLNGPNGISMNVLNSAKCVIILPSVKKAGFIVGGEYGRGIMTCRSGENFTGRWTSPSMMQSSGGSVGLQAGGQATDFVVLVMNSKGAHAVMNGKAKLGADASVAAGPVGRDAEAATNASMTAEMLSYSHTKGAFAGVSLAGTSLGPDNSANEKLYGKKVTPDQIFAGDVQPPSSATEMLSLLQEKSPKTTARE